MGCAGARQVDKTWLLKEFGRECFDDVAYVSFEKSTVELWDYVTQVNLKNAFFISQKAMPELKKTKGNILFTTSGSSIEPPSLCRR